ncbi:MAG: FAD-dependent oxidoreductase [Phycisphaerales bacterium]|jgi:heterodisulfide reductase subunit A
MVEQQGPKRVLVLGAGIAGCAAAQRLADAGCEVHLIERQSRIGGHAARMGCKATDVCLRCNVCVADEFFRKLNDTGNIQIHTDTELTSLEAGQENSRYRAVLNHKPDDAQSEVDIDSVIVATGHDPYDASVDASWGYGRGSNIIDGVEAEKQLAEHNELIRPSDGQMPKRLAFVQCVGSRSDRTHRRPEESNYCSAVCCSYALRIAQLAKYLKQDCDVTIFYMDIQNFGKGFNEFYKQCRDSMSFIRSRPYEVNQNENGTVTVSYAAESAMAQSETQLCKKDFDMVVLSVGIRPRTDSASVSDVLSIATDEYGFFGLKSASAISDLQHKGVYAIGTCEGPKDIKDSITQAEAVSAMILGDCGTIQNTKSTVHKTNDADTIEYKRVLVNQDVLVIGGGVAAMQTAIGLSRLGHNVTLVCSEQDIGGAAANNPQLYGYIGGDLAESEAFVRTCVSELIDKVTNDSRINIKSNVELQSVEGELGNFRFEVGSNGSAEDIAAGAIVLAVGAGNRKSPLSELINKGRRVPRNIAIVMDLLAEQTRAVCAEVLSAAELLVKQYGAEVKLYCNNLRVAAHGLEAQYKRARQAGVVIIKCNKPPVIADRGYNKTVTVEDEPAGCELTEEFDLVVIADAVSVNGQKTLSKFKYLKAGPESALQVDNVWALPVASNIDGIFVVGGAKGNSELREAQADGLAAAYEIHELLKDSQIEIPLDAAVVDADKCVLCLTCLRSCPHGAISIDTENETAKISEISCRRCGICVVQCPAGAIELPRYTTEQIAAEAGDEPKVTVFACENSVYPLANAVGGCKDNVTLIKVPCAGKVDPKEVLRELQCGADKVKIFACHKENCKYINGSGYAAKRIAYIKSMLERAGLDANKVTFCELASVEPAKFLKCVKE